MEKEFTKSLLEFTKSLLSLCFLLLMIYFIFNYFKNDDSVKLNEIKIGDITYTQNNLSVAQFSNGDPITIVNSDEEWLRFIIEKKPACRIVGDELNKDWREKGLVYNYYALSDYRGLAPKGWSIMNLPDWEKLFNEMNSNPNNYHFFRIHTPNMAVIEDGSFLQLDQGGAWWINEYKPRIVGIIETEYGIQMDNVEFNINGGFAVRCIKVEKTFWEKIGL